MAVLLDEETTKQKTQRKCLWTEGQYFNINSKLISEYILFIV